MPAGPANESHAEQAPNKVVVVVNQTHKQPAQNKGAAEPKEKPAQKKPKSSKHEKVSKEARSDGQKAPAPATTASTSATSAPTATTSAAPEPTATTSAAPAPAQRPAKKAPKRDRQKANKDKAAGAQAPAAPAGQQQRATSTDTNSQANTALPGTNRTQQVASLTPAEVLQRDLLVSALASGNIELARSITMSIVQNQMMGQMGNSASGGGSLGSNALSQAGQVPLELSQQHVGMACAPNVGSQGAADAGNSFVTGGQCPPQQGSVATGPMSRPIQPTGGQMVSQQSPGYQTTGQVMPNAIHMQSGPQTLQMPVQGQMDLNQASRGMQGLGNYVMQPTMGGPVHGMQMVPQSMLQTSHAQREAGQAAMSGPSSLGVQGTTGQVQQMMGASGQVQLGPTQIPMQQMVSSVGQSFMQNVSGLANVPLPSPSQVPQTGQGFGVPGNYLMNMQSNMARPVSSMQMTPQQMLLQPFGNMQHGFTQNLQGQSGNMNMGMGGAFVSGNMALPGSVAMSMVQNQMMGQMGNSTSADANQRFGGGSLGSSALSPAGQVPLELNQQHVGMACAPNVGSQGAGIPNSNADTGNSFVTGGQCPPQQGSVGVGPMSRPIQPTGGQMVSQQSPGYQTTGQVMPNAPAMSMGAPVAQMQRPTAPSTGQIVTPSPTQGSVLAPQQASPNVEMRSQVPAAVAPVGNQATGNEQQSQVHESAVNEEPKTQEVVQQKESGNTDSVAQTPSDPHEPIEKDKTQLASTETNSQTTSETITAESQMETNPEAPTEPENPPSMSNSQNAPVTDPPQMVTNATPENHQPTVTNDSVSQESTTPEPDNTSSMPPDQPDPATNSEATPPQEESANMALTDASTVNHQQDPINQSPPLSQSQASGLPSATETPNEN